MLSKGQQVAEVVRLQTGEGLLADFQVLPDGAAEIGGVLAPQLCRRVLARNVGVLLALGLQQRAFLNARGGPPSGLRGQEGAQLRQPFDMPPPLLRQRHCLAHRPLRADVVPRRGFGSVIAPVRRRAAARPTMRCATPPGTVSGCTRSRCSGRCSRWRSWGAARVHPVCAARGAPLPPNATQPQLAPP